MNYSIQKLIDDFVKKIGEDDIKMLQTVSPDIAVNYIFFLYKKFYGAYPTGEVYELLANKFTEKEAA